MLQDWKRAISHNGDKWPVTTSCTNYIENNDHAWNKCIACLSEWKQVITGMQSIQFGQTWTAGLFQQQPMYLSCDMHDFILDTLLRLMQIISFYRLIKHINCFLIKLGTVRRNRKFNSLCPSQLLPKYSLRCFCNSMSLKLFVEQTLYKLIFKLILLQTVTIFMWTHSFQAAIFSHF